MRGSLLANRKRSVTDCSLAKCHPKTVEHLQRYCNLTVFKTAAVRHLGFLKFKFLTVVAVKNPILQHRTKFRKDRSNRCEDITIFVIFKMAVAAILDFQKFEILTVDPL